VTGIGDAALNGRELAVATYLTEHVIPVLIGRDPARIATQRWPRATRTSRARCR
jgi:L-alanine-DL-glutamate epimerase-like enolase superfamily enzyme